MNHCTNFTKKLRDRCGTINCIDESYQHAFNQELSIVEAFIEAATSEEEILIDGEKATIDELDESIIQSVVTRLQLVANGEPVTIGAFPVQDDVCHHPGCDFEHEYDDDHFHEHCELCQIWLHVNMPINIVIHAEKGHDLCVCHECVTDDKYLQAGYTDDAGHLQCIRAHSGALLRMVDVAYKRSQIEGIASGQEFFEKREHFKSTYVTIMNAIANEWNMGDADNFHFLKDHANKMLECLYAKK